MAPTHDTRSGPTAGEVDEANAESFPASDAPSWTSAHLGAPWTRPRLAEHGPELRSTLRADVEKIGRVTALSVSDAAARRGAMEDFVARGLLEAGRAVTRQPTEGGSPARNVEAELRGAQPGHGPVVVAARYDAVDASGLAVLLSMARELGTSRLVHTTRLLAFPRGGGRAYVERLRGGPKADVVLSLEALDLARGHDDRLVFLGNWRSRCMLRVVQHAFCVASRVPSSAFAIPTWIPRVANLEHSEFLRAPWPAVLVSEHRPWRRPVGSPSPDVDRMASAVPGLVSVVVRLAGARP